MNLLDYPIPETICTERLYLRNLVDADASALYQLRTSTMVNRYIDRLPPENMESVKKWIRKTVDNVATGKYFYRAICLAPTDALSGTICAWNFREADNSVEIGFELVPSCWGNGYAGEALEALLDICSATLGLRTIEAYAQSGNRASRKLLEKYGFRHVRTAMEYSRISDGKLEQCIYQLQLTEGD